MPTLNHHLYKKLSLFETINKKVFLLPSISSSYLIAVNQGPRRHLSYSSKSWKDIKRLFNHNPVQYCSTFTLHTRRKSIKSMAVDSSFSSGKHNHSPNLSEAASLIKENAMGSPLSSSLLKNVAVAIDCEMVECGYTHQALARCSIVDYNSNVVEDIYVRPDIYVTDYRTRYSGITPKHLRSPSCVSLKMAQKRVTAAIENKIVIGHSIDIDLGVLGLRVPCNHIIDIKTISALNKLMVENGWEYKGGFSLKKLTKTLLKRDIQCRTHCSVEDACATMEVFKVIEEFWMKENSWIVQDLCDRKKYLEDQFWPDDCKNN